MKLIRIILGSLILFFDAIIPVKRIKRSAAEQDATDQKTQKLSLYQFHACPFCVKVRRVIRQLNLKIKLLDAKNDTIGSELLKEGGKRKVPCLRIEDEGRVQWMYESKTIIAYLENSFKE